MRVARLRVHRFRGFKQAELALSGSVVIAGEPRAGRTDLVEALRRVLDPRSTTGRVNPLDIYRPVDGDDPQLTEVEVTLLDLGADLSALLDEYLEAIDTRTGLPAKQGNSADAVLGVRLCYRATYDLESDTGEHWVDSPALSDPSSSVFHRVRRADREALPVLFIDSQSPMQVRAEGAFRRLIAERDQTALKTALEALSNEVSVATSAFSRSSLIAGIISEILAAGPDAMLALTDPARVEIVPDDGSLAGLLRALQPAIELDAAGPLPLRSHGSTATGIFTVAESIVAAQRARSQLVVVGDDFGDTLDAPSSEHSALLLRHAAGQAILTTRRPDVIRAFDSTQLIRLTRSHSERRQHRLASTDKAGRLTRSLILDRLLSAITSRTIVLVEGPHDADAYGALSTRLARKDGSAGHSFAARGMRLVSPPGTDGGITRLPSMARVAKELGFHVRAIVDRDTPGPLDAKVTELMAEAEAVVILPVRCAVEAALVKGVTAASLRQTVELLQKAGQLPQIPQLPDDQLAGHLIDNKLLKKPGVHLAWVQAVRERPSIATNAIRLICSDELGQLDVPDVP